MSVYRLHKVGISAFCRQVLQCNFTGKSQASGEVTVIFYRLVASCQWSQNTALGDTHGCLCNIFSMAVYATSFLCLALYCTACPSLLLVLYALPPPTQLSIACMMLAPAAGCLHSAICALLMYRLWFRASSGSLPSMLAGLLGSLKRNAKPVSGSALLLAQLSHSTQSSAMGGRCGMQSCKSWEVRAHWVVVP